MGASAPRGKPALLMAFRPDALGILTEEVSSKNTTLAHILQRTSCNKMNFHVIAAIDIANPFATCVWGHTLIGAARRMTGRRSHLRSPYVPARLSLERRRPQWRDNVPCSRSWCDRVVVAPPRVAGPTIDQGSFCPPQVAGAAYCRVEMQRRAFRRLPNKKWPGLLANRVIYASTVSRVCSVSSNFTGCPVFRRRTVGRSSAKPCGAMSSTFSKPLNNNLAY